MDADIEVFLQKSCLPGNHSENASCGAFHSSVWPGHLKATRECCKMARVVVSLDMVFVVCFVASCLQSFKMVCTLI